MQKIRKLFLGLLAVGCLSLTLTACKDDPSVSSLSLRGYPNTFTVGEEFSSKGLLVEATTKDGTINVSDVATIDNSKVDMTKPGVYAVLVKYENIEMPYYITVEPVVNEQRLIALAVDTTNVKLNYAIGETFDSTGLALIATYQNSNDDPNEVKYLTDLTDFNIVIRDSNNLNVTGAFTTSGTYYVYVTQGSVRTSFTISVINERSSVADAVSAAVANQASVAGGSSYSTINSNIPYDYANTSVLYEYGDNLLALSYYNGANYYECYSLKNGVASGYKVNEATNLSSVLADVTADSIKGPKYSLCAGTKEYFGAEQMLKALYDLGNSNPNNDYSETIKRVGTDTGGIRYEYSFSFGLLESPAANTYYLHKISVSFALSTSNILESLIVESNTYVVNNSKTDFTIVPKGEPNSQAFYSPDRVLPGTNYPSDFPVITSNYSVSDCMARLKTTTSKSSYSYKYQISQYGGQRTATSKYPDLG